jgi:hypothetical protein
MRLLRFWPAVALALAGIVLPAAAGDNLEGYLTKDGKLAQPLEIRDVQGGFAGFTGTYIKVDAEGKWSRGKAQNDKLTEESTGTLSKEDLAKLAKALAGHDLLNLKNQGKPSTNPHVVKIVFGKHEAVWNMGTAAKLPKYDPKAKDSVEQRYVGVMEAVRELTGTKEDKK